MQDSAKSPRLSLKSKKDTKQTKKISGISAMTFPVISVLIRLFLQRFPETPRVKSRSPSFARFTAEKALLQLRLK